MSKPSKDFLTRETSSKIKHTLTIEELKKYYWVYGEFDDDEIEILLKHKGMDDVKFIVKQDDLAANLSSFSDDESCKIILYKPTAHCQAIFAHKNKEGDIDIFIFDSLGADKLSNLEDYTSKIYNKLPKDSVKFNIFFTKNQRQVPPFGCMGFTLSDLEIMRANPQFVTQIKEVGLVGEEFKDNKNITAFYLPPEFMLATQKLSNCEEYVSHLRGNAYFDESSIKEFEKSMVDFFRDVYETVPASKLKKSQTMADFQNLAIGDDEKLDSASSDDKARARSISPLQTVQRKKEKLNDRNEIFLSTLANALMEVKYSSKNQDNDLVPSVTVQSPVGKGRDHKNCFIGH